MCNISTTLANRDRQDATNVDDRSQTQKCQSRRSVDEEPHFQQKKKAQSPTMKTQIASALLVATMALGGAPSIASAASAPADTISVLQTKSSPVQYVANAEDGSLLNGPNIMQIQFENRGDEVATDVEFEVDTFGAPVATIDDVGKFSKDAVVNHSFVNVGDRNSTVSVVGVKYADGSEWSANGQQPFVSRRQAAVAPVVPYVPSTEN
jgi:hypothetical protein